MSSNAAFNAVSSSFNKAEKRHHYLISKAESRSTSFFLVAAPSTIETLEGRELLGWSLVDTP